MRLLASLIAILVFYSVQAQVAVHPAIGTIAYSKDSTFSIKLINKKQNYLPSEIATADRDINSPKSVNMHPNGMKYYVNSLEGATTVVYDFKTNEKKKVIRHKYTDADTILLGSKFKPFYEFTHYLPDEKHPASPFGGWGAFFGKPVESTFSHGGKYLWIPYYRRNYDINAQDPSAVAIIDTETDSINRLMDTGPLPKMIATSSDGKFVAISHWGNNTVGIINIESENPFDWHYIYLAVIDYQLKLNHSLTESVDRDNNSGYCLRGTAFTPDNHFLLVGCMAGGYGIAVVDLQNMQYLGRITGNMPNLRHLLIRDGYIYLSINRDGYIQRMPLSTFLNAIPALRSSITKTTSLSGWQNCKVGGGARTIEFSPDGRYIYAACNSSSSLYVVDSKTMSVVTSIPVDSYPVGLEVSKDGHYVFTSSQGHSKVGGNCVDIFEVSLNP